MQSVSAILLAFVTVLTFLFFPIVRSYSASHGIDSYLHASLIGGLSVIRGAVFFFALLAAIKADGWNALFSSRALQITIAIAAVVAVEIFSLGFHLAAGFFAGEPARYNGFETAATLLPVILIACSFRPVPSIALAGSILAALIAIGGAASFALIAKAGVKEFVATVERADGPEQLPADGPVAEMPVEAIPAEPKAPIKLADIVAASELPRSTTDAKVFEKAFFEAIDLAIQYWHRIDAGDPPSIRDINTLDNATSDLVNRIDNNRPDITKALERRAKFDPRFHKKAPW